MGNGKLLQYWRNDFYLDLIDQAGKKRRGKSEGVHSSWPTWRELQPAFALVQHTADVVVYIIF